MLSALSSSAGRYAIVAIDHRDSLQAVMGVASRDAVVSLKIDIVRTLSPFATGVMLDPEFCFPDVVSAGALAPGVGYTAALEAQGYLSDPGGSVSSILDGWSVAQAAASGAAAAKLLIPYHPDHHLAEDQVEFAASVIEECTSVGLPLMLEPLFFGVKSADERTEVVLRTALRFSALRPDLLKLPFPCDVAHQTDHGTWTDRCAEISSVVTMPWILLSGGGSFESFAQQLEAAVAGGCAGFAVGRALWSEAVSAPVEDRVNVLQTLVVPRLRQLYGLVA
jgi:tagatose-1,6-bisphosphate aldolase